MSAASYCTWSADRARARIRVAEASFAVGFSKSAALAAATAATSKDVYNGRVESVISEWSRIASPSLSESCVMAASWDPAVTDEWRKQRRIAADHLSVNERPFMPGCRSKAAGP